MLTVICGSMFSEKSTELQRRGKRFERAGKKVGYFKPNIDTRYSVNELVTHSGQKVPAINIPVNEPEVIYYEAHDKKFDVILIDEIQFFSKDVIAVICGLLLGGKTIIVAGLDMDYKSVPFLITAELMAMAEEVLKLKAVCSNCGNDAWISNREVPKGERVLLGGNEEYKPLCRKCYNKTKS